MPRRGKKPNPARRAASKTAQPAPKPAASKRSASESNKGKKKRRKVSYKIPAFYTRHDPIESHAIAIVLPQKKGDSASIKATDAHLAQAALQAEQLRLAAQKRKVATEKKNKLAGLAFERTTLAKQTAKAASDGVTGLRNTHMVDVATLPAAVIHEPVQVDPALGLLGPARYGGPGVVVAVYGVGGNTKVDVKYTLDGRTETGIDVVARVTHHTMYEKQPPRAAAKQAPPVRQQRSQATHHPYKHVTLIQALPGAYSNGWGKGWLRCMRFYPTGFGKTRPRLFEESEIVAALKDVAALENFIAGRASQGGGGSRHAARKKSSKGKFVARASKFDPYVQKPF